MEKILSKSKSRYFFGTKKKSAKDRDQGISSSDVCNVIPEGGHNGTGLQTISPHIISRNVRGEELAMTTSGPSTQCADTSPGVHCGPVYPQPHKPDNSASANIQHHCPSIHSQSRFEVQISPTAFSPIMMPSSTAYGPSVAAAPAQRQEFPPSNPKHDGARGIGSNPRAGDIHGHSRSQSSVTPNQAANSRGKHRRYGIQGAVMETVGDPPRGMHRWHGQSLMAERYIPDTLTNGSPSISSDILLVQPSASAPVSSGFPAVHGGLLMSDLHETSTVPEIAPIHSPLPRSIPSYNLAGLTPVSSGHSSRKDHTEVDPRTRVPLNRHPNHELDICPRRELPLAPPPATYPVGMSNSSTNSHTLINHNTANTGGVSSEIGYRGLAFPLPPSSEEGLALSYSSSQSSLFSEGSGHKMGTGLVTPKRLKEGTDDHDVKTPKSIASRGTPPGSGKGLRERSFGLNEGHASPTPEMGTVKRRRERNDSTVSAKDSAVKRDVARDVRERVDKELANVLNVNLDGSNLRNGATENTRVRAASEMTQDVPTNVELPTQPQKISESTKPLSLTPGRKTLQTMRSVSTGLGERKQLHISISNRDLSSSFNGVDGRGERVRTTTAIPGRGAMQRDAPGFPQHNAQLPTPLRIALPTPPHSSSTLSCLAGERNDSDIHSQVEQRWTLEEVTNALHNQRGRFDELVGYVLDIAQQHAAERDAYSGRVGRLEGALAKMEREVRGLRWLVLENAKMRKNIEERTAEGGVVSGKPAGNEAERKLKRSSTMPPLATLPSHPPIHARRKRDAIGLGLGFSPDSAIDSPASLLLRKPGDSPKVEDETPTMDDIIDKLMGVRQWASADVRVSIVDTGNTDDGRGDSKRIVFRER